MERWTIATLVVSFILIALFIKVIVNYLSWSIATSINAVSSFYQKSIENVTKKEPEVLYQGNAGNYSYTIYKPESSSTFSTMATYITYLIGGIVYILSTPQLLIIVIGVALLIAALEMRTR